jgi:hypothetical protein
VPDYITEITVEAWGGGGRGGDADGGNKQAGGGGGGAYARSVLSVEPGDTFTLFVGAGSTTSSPGQSSTFDNGAVEAVGGESVAENDANGGIGGQAINSKGDVTFSGGDGADAVSTGSTRRSGGGGSSAGSGVAGNDAVNDGGADAPAGGGGGGDAGGEGEDGNPGGMPGAGGGGGRTAKGNPNPGGGKPPEKFREGGAGGDGRIRISYQDPKLTFSQQPTNTAKDAVIDPPVKVRAEDSDGNLVSIFDGDVTLTIEDNPGGGALSGTTTVQAQNGVATFSNLSIDEPGTGYTLLASSPKTDNGVSASFDIFTSTVAQYDVQAPGQGLTCETIPVSVEARDSNGNPVSPPDGTTLSLASDTGKGTWSRVRSANGTLTDSTAGDGVGSYEFPGGESAVELSFDYPDIASDPEGVVVSADDGSASGSSDPISVSLAGFRFIDDDASTSEGVISDQIAGKPSDTGAGASSVGLQAVEASSDDPTTCQGVFDDGDVVTVDLGAECRDPALCSGGIDFRINGNAVATNDDNGDASNPAAFNAVDLEFGPNSTADLTLDYADAGAMRLYARREIRRDDGSLSGSFLRGTSNDFAVRPFGFFIDFDPDGDGAFDDRRTNASCGGQASCAVDAGGDVFATAGSGLDIQLSAVVWAAGDDSDNDGVPDSNQAVSDNALTPNFGQEATAEDVAVTRTLVAPSAGSSGNLSGGNEIGGFSGGSATATLAWDEVGIIDLAARLADIDSSGGYLGDGGVTGSASNVGRFIPARLEASGNTPEFQAFCSDATAFSYLDQSFGYAVDPAVTITAYNANGAVTENYGASFWKLPVPPAFPNRSYSDESGSAATLAADLSTTLSWADGGDDSLVGSDTATIIGERLTYERNGLEEPFDASVDLTIPADDLTDADDVCVAASGICNTGAGDTGADFVFDGDGTTSGQQPIDATELRLGRLRIDDAFGPEIAPVRQLWQLEYWNGNTWLRNGDDSCTRLSLVDEVRLDPDADLTNGNAVAGNREVDVTPNTGTTQIRDNIADVAGGEILFDTGDVGQALVEYDPSGEGEADRGWIEARARLATDFPYLVGDTDGDGTFGEADQEPVSGRVTFGIFAGQEENIYRREVFPAP